MSHSPDTMTTYAASCWDALGLTTRPVAAGASQPDVTGVGDELMTSLTIVYGALRTLERPPGEIAEADRRQLLAVGVAGAERLLAWAREARAR